MNLQNANSQTDIWNSLEILKLGASVLTPITVLVISLYFNKLLKKLEYTQWRNQKLIEKRLLIYEEIAPILNDILCYFSYVGSWKDFSPLQIINFKRVLDKKVNLAAPLFSTQLFTEYQSFIHLCYEHFVGWGNDARLQSDFQRRREAAGDKWEESWNSFFSDKDKVSQPEEVRKSYQRIMAVFSEDIGLHPAKPPDLGRLPRDIR